MMGGAQLEIEPDVEPELEPETQPPFPSQADDDFMLVEPGVRPSALKQEVAEKLAAHRQRRARLNVAGSDRNHDTAPATHLQQQPQKKSRVAAAVAERYAQTPSYRAFLAQEAERALQQAAAAAEIAQRNAEAVAAVQQELLAELGKWEAPQRFDETTAAVLTPGQAQSAPPTRVAGSQAAGQPIKTAGLTVRLYEDIGRPRVPPAVNLANTANTANTDKILKTAQPVKHSHSSAQAVNPSEARALEEEIAFRQAPVFDDYRATEPAIPLPANLLAFPRQLVATVRARPSLALGPLREESGRRASHNQGQLRIFEVEPDQIHTAPEPISLIPEWSSIWLDAHVPTEPLADPDLAAPAILPSLLPLQTAPMHLRAMAATVDCLLVLAGFIAFTAAFAHFAGTITVGIPLGVAAVVILGALFLAYQFLFFTLSDQTPGMRYARVGLCTFSDENPSRRAMRKRVLAQILAVAPLGLGLAWALLDDDRLGWHDRISRMYQRAY